MATFALKPCVNRFEKISIFRLFELVVFLAKRVVLLVLEYRKTHFPGLHKLKKKLEKWPFFDQNYGFFSMVGKIFIFGQFEVLVFMAYNIAFWL